MLDGHGFSTSIHLKKGVVIDDLPKFRTGMSNMAVLASARFFIGDEGSGGALASKRREPSDRMRVEQRSFRQQKYPIRSAGQGDAPFRLRTTLTLRRVCPLDPCIARRRPFNNPLPGGIAADYVQRPTLVGLRSDSCQLSEKGFERFAIRQQQNGESARIGRLGRLRNVMACAKAVIAADRKGHLRLDVRQGLDQTVQRLAQFDYLMCDCSQRLDSAKPQLGLEQVFLVPTLSHVKQLVLRRDREGSQLGRPLIRRQGSRASALQF